MEGLRWDRQDEFIGELFEQICFLKCGFDAFSKLWHPLSPYKWVLYKERGGHNLSEKGFQFFHPL